MEPKNTPGGIGGGKCGRKGGFRDGRVRWDRGRVREPCQGGQGLSLRV